MDVKTVCLGLLTDGEASGYDLKKTFESTFGHFFAAGYGSIYPALQSLADDGLVDCEQVAQDGKPDRKVYRITAAGRERLQAALTKTAPSHKVRSEFLATLYFAHLMDAADVQAVLAHQLSEVRRFEELFADIDARCADDWPDGMRFVLGFGKAMMAAMRDYIETNDDLPVRTADLRRTAAV